MHIPKKYLHDKLILLLASTNIFLALLGSALVLLRGGIGEGVDGYIVQYRANLGLSAFQRGGLLPIISFIFFMFLVLLINLLLSVETYRIRRALAATILWLGALVLLLALIVSNALLALY